MYIYVYSFASGIPQGQIGSDVFCGYVFLRNALAKTFIWYLPEHKVKRRLLGGAEVVLGVHAALGSAGE